MARNNKPKFVCVWCDRDTSIPLDGNGLCRWCADVVIPPPPALPTDAPPGSMAKIEAMARRRARREGLFHPHDADQWVMPEWAEGDDDADDA